MMAQLLPIKLTGDTLGERHQYLNGQVNQAVAESVSFQDIEDLPECSPVDRLFKIDLAIKLENIDYILKTIKDDDMLYVSRALKCKWLLNRRDIINPKYLEDTLYPEMVMPAISKMKHWISINLRDSVTCQDFYQYYKDTKFDYAVKFLNQCDNEYLLNEFPKILTSITPHYLKVLGEKYPKLVQIYYDSIASNNDLVNRYLKEEEVFYNSIKFLLKLDADLFLNITEKYHNLSTSNKLSPSATKYILRFHKNRFMAKPELYVMYLLHMPTVAQCLNVEECQDVVIKFARANYLQWWFSYEKVEPLVKRVNRDERAAFKKRIFIEKDIGERVDEWPYELPASPVIGSLDPNNPHVFDDLEFEPIVMVRQNMGLRLIKKRKGRKEYVDMIESCEVNTKSELQKLFDEFRFFSFEGTLHELKTRIRSASSADRRRDMLLVLVSKAGGRTNAVRELLQLALSLRNEPVHERAAVVRSLVKRASVWRLPQDVWDTMVEYGRGLGLDGSEAEAQCLEGLHAIVIRQIIATGSCEPLVRTAFLENFSMLTEYKLETNERIKIGLGLQNILVTVAADADPEEAANYLSLLLDVLEEYKIRFETSPAVSAIAALSELDLEASKPLLRRLYNARVGRRDLLRQYLKLRPDDSSLLNALRHDPGALTPEWVVELIIEDVTQANRFLLKLSVYFNEKEGHAEQIRQAILDKIALEPNTKLAKPLAILAGSVISSMWDEQDTMGGEHCKLAAALRANMHHARPAPDALALGWRKTGLKAIAWRAMRCRPAQVTQLVQSLLKERAKRTVRLALILAQRTDCASDSFSEAVTIRPLATLRAALLYFRSLGDAADPRIWDIIKPLLSSVDLDPCKGIRHILKQVQWVPKLIKPDYIAMLYLALDKISNRRADYFLRVLMPLLSGVSEDLLKTVLLRMLSMMEGTNPKFYPAIIIRYLMLSKSDEELKARLHAFGEPLFIKLDDFRDGNVYFFRQNYEQIMTSLQYNFAFFDIKYECCLPVIEKVLSWMQTFMPKEKYFDNYVKIHATMLYYKAIRQSIKQKPELFEDPVKKMTEGVDVVGFIFGRYIAKEVTELMSKYFDSVLELYHGAFIDYLNDYFMFGIWRETFTAAVARGILSEGVGRETRLAIHVLKFLYDTDSPEGQEIKKLLMKKEDIETQYFSYAEIYA